MKKPTLTVVLPNYNHGHYLVEAIEGIATQSRPPDEFLILDDASTDRSVEIITPYLRQFPFLRLIRQERNQGVIAAVQRLLAEATGDYLFAAAADDIRLPGFFDQAMDLVAQHPQAGGVFGIVRLHNPPQGRELTATASRWSTPMYAPPSQFLDEYLRVERPSQSPSAGTIYRREALRDVGGFRADLGSWADTFAFWAIGLKHGFCYLPRQVTEYRELQGSFSQAGNAVPRRVLDLIARAASVMRSPEFRGRFPESFVRSWVRAYRWQVVRDHFLGPETPGVPRPGFVRRNLRRLPRLTETLALFAYRGTP